MKIQIGRFTLDTKGSASAALGDGITHIPASTAGWWPVIRESFAGAWQRGITVPVEDALAHPTYWACVTLIAGDVAKIRPMLVEERDGIETEVERQSPYAPVLERPNHYQNRIQFFTYWMLSKLMRGNAYALKARDSRGIVTDLYLLDPLRVRPLVSTTGQVYYACQQDLLADLTEASLVIPAREIIHDIGFAPYHPLCGFSPVYACGYPAIQALTINRNATKLFNNGFQLGGVLAAPGTISETTAKRLEQYWQENYSGADNAGKIAVVGDGMKFEQPTTMSAVDAQVIDQLKWNDEKICAVHHVPPYKVAVGPLPSYNNVEALGQDYYGQALQLYFESIELCLTEGLELRDVKRPDGGIGYEVEFDIAELDRMDSVQRMEVATKGVTGGVFKPNEARAKFNLPKVKGGDQVLLQRQNWPIDLLGSDNVKPVTPAPQQPAALPPAPTKAAEHDELLSLILKKLEEVKYNPDEPRDDHGRWTTGGAGSVLDKPSSEFTPAHPDGYDTKERFSDGHGKYTAERTALHDEIVKHYMEGTTAVDKPASVILGGGPASGKSTIVRNEGIGKDNTVHVDPDAIRTHLPEYRDGIAAKDAAIATFTHEEASDIAKRLIREALSGNRNIVLDGTGDSSLEKLTAKVAAMRSAGHEVVGQYVTVDTDIAVRRALERGQKTGRYVPETFTRMTHAAVSRVVPEAVHQGLFDRFQLHDTSSGKTVLVASAKGNKLTVHHQKRWDAFLGKGK